MDYKPRGKIIVPCKNDLVAANRLAKTLSKHRLILTYYGHEGVGFYKKGIVNEDKIPVYSKFHMDRKEFHLLLDKLNEIDERDKKIEELQSKFHTYSAYLETHHR
jgi:hypothetical protein